MADIEDLIRRVVDQMMTRQAHPRIATVTSYDPNRHAVKAKQMPEGHETGWIPIGTQHVGSGIGIAIGPNVGDQVVLGYHEGDIESPFVMARLHSDKARPPVAKSGEVVIQTPNSMIKIDQAGNLTQNSGGSLTQSASGGVSTTAGGSMTQSAGGDMGISAGGNMSMSAAGSLGFSGTGQFSYNGFNVLKGLFADGSGNTLHDGINVAIGGTTALPSFDFYRATTTTGQISSITATTENASGTSKVFADIEAWNDYGGAGSEFAHWTFRTVYNGTFANRWYIGAGLYSPGATGGDFGPDSINTLGYYLNGVSIFVSPAFTGSPTAPTQTAGDNSTKLATTAYVAAAVGAGKLQKFFESTQQTITSGGPLTLAHGLGAQPKLITAALICQTSEFGYSVNNELEIGNGFSGNAGQNGGIAIVPDATYINVQYSSPTSVFIGLNKSTGAGVLLTNANWKLIVRAWA